ncbi:hypothetical protein PilKf_01158 [Pillotina sp. SPG140]|jgi:hypothetical protein
MRKIGICVAVLLVSSTMAFAEFNWSGWGRIGFVPVNTAGDTAVGHTFPDLGEGEPGIRAGLTASFTAENIGMAADISVANSFTAAGGDNIYGWWKPSEVFKMNIGKLNRGTLRGGYSTESFADFGAGVSGVDGEDGIFTQFSVGSGTVLEFTPTENFFAGVALNVNPAYATEATTTEDAFKNIHIAAGYTLANVGVFKVGYVGNAQKPNGITYDGSTKRLELAFKSNLVEKVPFELGFKWRPDPESKGNDSEGETIDPANSFAVSAGISLNVVDVLPITAIVTGGFGGDNANDNIAAYLNCEYTSLPIFNIGASAGTKIVLDGDENEKIQFGFDVYLQKAYGLSNIKIGFGAWTRSNVDSALVFAVPIALEYEF